MSVSKTVTNKKLEISLIKSSSIKKSVQKSREFLSWEELIHEGRGPRGTQERVFLSRRTVLKSGAQSGAALCNMVARSRLSKFSYVNN